MNIGLLSLVMTVAQPAAPAVPPPALPPAPFLFVKVGVPAGAKVVWQAMTDGATVVDGTVGLRPGYPYRIQITDLPGAKGTAIYPSMEVRGTLVPRPGLDVSKHPVPINLSERDIERILEGRLITKIFYLEDPEKAARVAGEPGESLESAAADDMAAIKEARTRGRPMLIIRVGERPWTKEELAWENVPGTVLLPGAKTLPVPAAPPRFPFAGVQIYDPIIGAKGASEECLADGGDVGMRLGVGADGRLRGLDPSDTAMQFKTPHGGTRVAPSNRVCICVPRFAAVRVETSVAGHESVAVPIAAHLIRPVAAVDVRRGTGESKKLEQIAGTIGAMRASGLETKAGPAAFDQWSGKPAGLASVKGLAIASQVRGPDEITAFPGCGSLILQKRLEPAHPEKIGEEVTFFLRFTNPTTEVMTEVVISDSLTTRLEYVDGTQKCSRAATFTSYDNEAGSAVLRWALDGKLPPGETGIISFKAKIK